MKFGIEMVALPKSLVSTPTTIASLWLQILTENSFFHVIMVSDPYTKPRIVGHIAGNVVEVVVGLVNSRNRPRREMWGS